MLQTSWVAAAAAVAVLVERVQVVEVAMPATTTAVDSSNTATPTMPADGTLRLMPTMVVTRMAAMLPPQGTHPHLCPHAASVRVADPRVSVWLFASQIALSHGFREAHDS